MPKQNKRTVDLAEFFKAFTKEVEEKLGHAKIKVKLHDSSNFDGDDIHIVFYNREAGVEQTITFDRDTQEFGQISFYSDVQI